MQEEILYTSHVRLISMYPFGMLMSERSYSSPVYRYGFNGKEKTDEVNGEGAVYDYGFRIYDSRLGRFLSVDPLFKNYAWNSTYSFAENDVIRSIDLDGLEKFIATVTYDDHNNITKRVVTFVDIRNRQTGHTNDILYKIQYKGPTGNSVLVNQQFKPTLNRNSPESFALTKMLNVNGVNKTNAQALEDKDMSELMVWPLLKTNINFKLDQAVPTAENSQRAANSLDRVSDVLKDNPGFKIQIVGNTSSEPTTYTNPNNPEGFRTGNEALSYDRAKYVYNELVRSGVNVNQISFTGVASTQPLPNIPSTDASNRRITLKLTQDKYVPVP